VAVGPHEHGRSAESIIGGGLFPHLTRVMLEADLPHAKDRLDRGFRLGLDLVLDGLASRLQSARNPSTAER
jgi:hypothetical protein